MKLKLETTYASYRSKGMTNLPTQGANSAIETSVVLTQTILTGMLNTGFPSTGMFSLSDELREDLIKTDIEIDPSDIKPSFPVTYIEFETPFKGWDGAFVIDVKLVSTHLNLQYFFIRYGENSEVEYTGMGGITFPYDEKISIKEIDKEFFRQDKFKNLTRSEVEQTVSDYQDANRLLLNFFLYVSNVDKGEKVVPQYNRRDLAKISNPKKRRRYEKIMKQSGEFGYTTIGKGYTSGSKSEVHGGSHNYDFRRGHWRKQWVGKKKDSEGNPQLGEKQRIQWIPPFIREGKAPKARKVKVQND